MKVTRTFKPIMCEHVKMCRECPYYIMENDGNMSHARCEHIDYNSGMAPDKDNPYNHIIPDVQWDTTIISIHCPFNKI